MEKVPLYHSKEPVSCKQVIREMRLKTDGEFRGKHGGGAKSRKSPRVIIETCELISDPQTCPAAPLDPSSSWGQTSGTTDVFLFINLCCKVSDPPEKKHEWPPVTASPFPRTPGRIGAGKEAGRPWKKPLFPRNAHIPPTLLRGGMWIWGGGYNQCSDAVEVHVLMKMVGFVRKQRSSGSESSLFFTVCVSNREPKEIRVFRDFLDRLVIEARREIG